jgi:predicted phosphodiesterase
MRMETLYNEVIDYAHKENLKAFKVFNLGDSLDGFLRNSQLWTLRYGVAESAVIFGEYMGKWLRALSDEFDIEYYQTYGNHGELRLLDGKKGEHKHDNIETVTGNIIRIINEDNPNFKYVTNKSGFIFTNIAGYNVMGIHGEVRDPVIALKEYSDIYDVKIDYLVSGHTHHSDFSNCGVRRGTIGVGSIVGCDDYSLQLRRSADATASFIIFEIDKGKVDEHTFVLN